MANLVTRTIDGAVRALRAIGPALSGVMAPLRAKDGTYGTQRMHARAQAEARRENYPRD